MSSSSYPAYPPAPQATDDYAGHRFQPYPPSHPGPATYATPHATQSVGHGVPLTEKGRRFPSQTTGSHQVGSHLSEGESRQTRPHPSRNPTSPSATQSHDNSQASYEITMEEARNNMKSWVSNELYHYHDSRSRIGMEIPKKEVHRLRYPPDLSTFFIDTTVMNPKDIKRNRNIPSDPQAAKRLFYLWGEDFVDINSLLEYAGTEVSCNICRQTVPFGTIPYDVDAWVEHWNNCEDIQMIFDTENPHNKRFLQKN
ncbi:hypothetical protein K435DRAFT_972289 [Dendrothele bispora CBS 962.96]|uniref:Uncharacterized protein n=1 Tax=Dendrothele bispora (strain CBS 962.96) TaxID=1314807 RepID=A0A4S8KZQ9_DENBC|nr:hypothetical protein K435DRAFT_972289 [Dendrothele bispora CBS 962.96]